MTDVGGLSRVPDPPAGHGLLRSKVVVVTAAAGTGIGSAAAERCLAEGARVVLSDRHERRLEETRARLAAEYAGSDGDGYDNRVAALPCDVTDDSQVRDLVAGAARRFGRLDMMVNNAGLGGTRHVVEMTDREWDQVLDITLSGTFRCTRAALRQMGAQDSTGVIVNNASVVGWRAQEGQAHYAAAKAGVMALTRCAAVEAAPLGVRVNAVAPSIAMHEHLAKVTSDETLARLSEREAFGRAAQPWEVATVIAWLGSDYATYLTGEVVSASSQHP